MGGMAAQIPIKDDQAANDAALEKVRADKRREVKDGHDGTWVAHPGLVPIAKAIFDEGMPGKNQLGVLREDVSVSREDLLRVPEGTRTEEGLRHNVRVGVQYLEAWLRGQGCVPLYHLMEDAATAEISRAQVWQQMRHGLVTPEKLDHVIAEELGGFSGGRFHEAKTMFRALSTAPRFEEFLTIPAYQRLLAFEQASGRTEVMTERKVADIHARRFEGITRPYSTADVEKLRGSVKVDYTLATMGAKRLWELLHTRDYVGSLGAITGGQAVQMVRAGLEALYISGWQVAADANTAGQMYPDQSLYPVDSVPSLVRRINSSLRRADQIEHAEGKKDRHWFAPMIADAEAGFGGPLNAFELMKAMIEAGAAGVHYEDQLASEKKCGHMGGKVLVPTSQFIRMLVAARLAADVLDVPTLLVARTDAQSAKLITSDIDERDVPFIASKDRTAEGFFRLKDTGDDFAIARGLAYAAYADLVWCETSTPDLKQAKRFAESIRAKFPNKMMAYNCSPSFNWKKNLDDATIAKFQRELGAMGYKFQFVTLAGFHSLNFAMFELASQYRENGMAAYSKMQEAEFAAEKHGYTATRHQREVGTGYFDMVAEVISGGTSSTKALVGSTEEHQF
jgi:isocitrate lyase